MRTKDPFKQFLRDSGVKITKNALVMGLPYTSNPFKVRETPKTTLTSKIPNKF